MTLQVSLSIRTDRETGTKALHLRADATEAAHAGLLALVRKYITKGAAPVVRHDGTNIVVLFHPKYLQRVYMAFPDCDMSARLHRRLAKQLEDELRSMPVPDLTIPGFQGELYDFQAQGIGWCNDHLDRFGVAMLNDEMGLGKTIQAISIAKMRRRKRVLVITTKSGIDSWARILRNLFPKVPFTVVDGTPAQRAVQLRTKTRFTLVNFEVGRVQVTGKGKYKKYKAANPDLFNQRWDMIICDEFHKAKNEKAQRTVGMLQLPKAEDELWMSGTPFLNSPLELWPTLHRLWPSRWPSYYEFEKNLVIKEGGKIVAYDPEMMMALQQFLAMHSIRRRKDQVGIDMPEVLYSTVPVELTREQRRLYNRIADEFRLEIANGEVRTIKGALPQITRLKQACFSPELYGGTSTSSKVKELHARVEQLVSSGRKAIMFSEYDEACQILLREFADYNPAYVSGRVTGRTKDGHGNRVSKRSLQEDKFNHDSSCKLYIGTITANQEAITLSAATDVLMIDRVWTPLGNEQAIGRSAAGGLRGVGQEIPVNVMDIVAKDTFEERIIDVLSYKKSLFNAVAERDAGRREKRIEVNRLTLSDIADAL